MPGTPAPSLTWPDYAVVGLSLAVLLAIGFRLTRRQHDTVDFFLARRRVPWWAAGLSFLATEISAVTIISVPATAYRENWEYLQFFVGSSLAKFAVAFLFIPAGIWVARRTLTRVSPRAFDWIVTGLLIFSSLWLLR